ncbi:MAG: hypothetical protein K1W18_07165 [Oscillospiraceae bacterium]
MFAIRDKRDLELAYELLGCLKRSQKGKEDKIIELKRSIRMFHSRNASSNTRIVKDEGIDGYVVLIDLPEYLNNKEEAEKYFEDKYVMHSRPSMFGCTGQAFTRWFKVFGCVGKFYAYHCVGYDV